MAERLLLQGRYFSKLRKLGMVGGVASAVSGVAAFYGFYVRRDKVFQDYEKTALVPAAQQKLDDRMMKLSGFKRNEEYPDLVFPPPRDLDTPEAMAQKSFQVPNLFTVYFEGGVLLHAFGRDALDVYSKCWIDDNRKSGYFKDEKERQLYRQKFVKLRLQFIEAFKKKYPKEVVKYAEWMGKDDIHINLGFHNLYGRQSKDPDKGLLKNFPKVFKMSRKQLPSQEAMLYFAKICNNPASGPIRYTHINGMETEQLFEQRKKFFEENKDKYEETLEKMLKQPSKANKIQFDAFKAIYKQSQ